MYTTWGTSSDNSNEDDAEDMALMAMEDSEPDTEKREGESVLSVSKIIEEVLEDVPCEGKYFGDLTVEQSSVVRLNLGASSKGESMGDSSVEPSSSIGIHINWDLGLMSTNIIVGVAPDSTTSREQIWRTCSFTNDAEEICSFY
ncbi:hypothetical protein H5410_006389 [Solanum commersonii]|uniref:Uncharacterized protein n=1 Tax=Solanum commersonii TaxID=4109 RepID=A0A9J6AA52_SOLCO|nr:hypothetical protein H5410_006389 [Solanum commersonii]